MTKPADLAKYITDPDSLNQLKSPELRVLWRECCPKILPSPIKLLLVRDLAFVAQSGGRKLPRQTEILINKAMKSVSVNRCGDKPEDPQPRTFSPATQRLPEGAKLVREWGGKAHEVTVLGEGLWFRYEGQTYRSLTQVAKRITGAHWSGPRFFGVHRCQETLHEPG